MQKIVINACYGGFGLSDAAHQALGHERIEYENQYGVTHHWKPSALSLDRDDPALIAIVEELGTAANGDAAELQVIEIPDGVEWEIDEYDGFERVAEKHCT